MYDICKDSDMFDIIFSIFVTESCEAWRIKNRIGIMFFVIFFYVFVKLVILKDLELMIKKIIEGIK